MDHRPTATYAEFIALMPWPSRLRAAARDIALRGLALGRRIDADTNWIRFPYYHHVFEDERRGFARQLDYLGNFGEFISLDAAVSVLESGDVIDGRYFCITFDDGFKSCLTGAAPILAERNIPAVFYVVTGLVGRSLPPDDATARRVFGFKGKDTALDFLSWDDCRALMESGMTIGSHSHTHAALAELEADAAATEMRESKAAIERELGVACHHFCTPYGLPGADGHANRVPAIAREAGYRSFVTGQRGPTRRGDDVFRLKRDHMLASWGNHQLRYFLSLP